MLLRIKSKLNFFVGLMFILILIPSNLKSLFIILLGIVVLYKAYKNKTKFNKVFFLNYSIIYFVILLTLIYNQSFSQGFWFAQTMVSLAIFPFYFSFISKDDYEKLNFDAFFGIYLISIFVFHVAVFSWFAIFEFSVPDTLRHFQEIVTLHLGKLSTHPIYISMHCSIALFLSTKLYKNELSIFKKIVLFLLQAFMILFLILHAKKGPIAAFLVSIFLYFIIFYKGLNLKIVIPFFLILTVLFFSIPSVKNRFSELIKIEKLTNENANSTNIRVAVYKNVFQLIKNSPIIGYGIGTHDQALQDNYSRNNQDILLEKYYNSHNQYLSFLLIGGPILLFLFLYFFVNNIKLAILSNNKIFVLLLLFYSIVMLTENILERESGVIFFSFFLSLFGFKNYQKLDEC